MKELEQLKLLISNLLEFERSQLLNAEFISSDAKSSRKLIELILNNKDINLEKLNFLLYKGQKKDALRKLVTRVKTIVYDIIISNSNIKDNPTYDERSKQIFNLEKRLLLSDILRLRGLFNLSESILDEIIESAKGLELYDLLVFALNKRLRSIAYLNSINKIDDIYNEIEQYQKFSYYYHMAVRYYYKFVYNYNELNKPNINFNQEITKAILEVENYFAESKSLDILYYLKFLKVTKLTIEEDALGAISELDNLYSIYKSPKRLFSKLKLGNVLINLSILNRQVYSFEVSEHYLLQSEKYLATPKLNFIYIYEQYFLTHLFSSNLPKARYYLELFNNTIESSSKLVFLRKSVMFGLSCEFIFSEGLEALKSDLFVESIKPMDLFSIQLKILQIMRLIDDDKLDSADYAIDAFRKYFVKCSKVLKINLRLQLIVKILKTFPSSSYNFKVLIVKNKRHLYQLSQPENAWRPNPHELIVFEEWILAKAAGKEYNHTEVMAKMKKRYLERKSPLNLMTA